MSAIAELHEARVVECVYRNYPGTFTAEAVETLRGGSAVAILDRAWGRPRQAVNALSQSRRHGFGGSSRPR